LPADDSMIGCIHSMHRLLKLSFSILYFYQLTFQVPKAANCWLLRQTPAEVHALVIYDRCFDVSRLFIDFSVYQYVLKQ
jgi:hypothetical protein